MYPAALTLVLVGIVLGIGLFVMAETRDGLATTYTGSDVDQNVSSATTLGDSTNTNYELKTVTAFYANDSAETITNYTTATNGVVTWGDDVSATGRLANITSTYTFDGAEKPETALTTSLTGVADFADWIAIIVVVIAAAIVLGIVLSSFGKQPGV